MRAPAPRSARDALDWPFFEPRHRAFAARLEEFIATPEMAAIDHANVDAACRRLARELGRAGLLDVAVAPPDGEASDIDSRSVCLARETLAWRDGLADFAFAMQGLGSGAIALAGSPELKRDVLTKVRSGEWLAAFALSEAEAGSDVAAMACTARAEGAHYVLDGVKTWISNGGIADVYTVFARTGEAPGARGLSAFTLCPDDPGFSIAAPSASTSSRRIRWRRCASRAAAFRPRAGWAHPVAASNWRCARSTSSAPPSRRRRSASAGARSTRRWRMSSAGACSAASSPTCN